MTLLGLCLGYTAVNCPGVRCQAKLFSKISFWKQESVAINNNNSNGLVARALEWRGRWSALG